jgi:Fe-S-cluster containining protein
MGNTDLTRDYIAIAQKYLCRVDGTVQDILIEMKRSGIVPPCGPGCAWCCRLPVSATVPEGMLAARHICGSLGEEDIRAFTEKAKAWLLWKENELPRMVNRGMDFTQAHLLHGPGCAFLSGGLCVIYPVRPMGCRVHFSYDENTCRPSMRPGALFDCSAQVVEVIAAVKPLCMEYRRELEARGAVFGDLVDLLPRLVLNELEKS